MTAIELTAPNQMKFITEKTSKRDEERKGKCQKKRQTGHRWVRYEMFGWGKKRNKSERLTWDGKLGGIEWVWVRKRERKDERTGWGRRLMRTETSFHHSALMRWDTGDLNRNHGKGCEGVGMEMPCYHGDETVCRSRWLTELLSAVNFIQGCSLRTKHLDLVILMRLKIYCLMFL